MNQTRIFTTPKLEKVVKEYISDNGKTENKYLGEGASTLTHVSHKKCWVIINKPTQYIVILPNVRQKDTKNITSIFKKTLYEQLIYDGIKVEYSLIEQLIGEINLYKNDNDENTNISLNKIISYFDDYWKYEFGNFDNMPFREITGRANSLPIKQLHWLFPKEKMNELLTACIKLNNL